MAKLYTVAIRWVQTPSSAENIKGVDDALGSLGDWVRFQAYTWLVWTDATAEHISRAVRLVVLAPNDSVLVIASDPSDFNGYAAPWVWQWLNDKQQPRLSALGDLYGSKDIPPRR